MTTPQPRVVGWHRFHGTRFVRVGQYEHIHVILLVIEFPYKPRGLAIQMVGKQDIYALTVFQGEFEYIELERIAA